MFHLVMLYDTNSADDPRLPRKLFSVAESLDPKPAKYHNSSFSEAEQGSFYQLLNPFTSNYNSSFFLIYLPIFQYTLKGDVPKSETKV